MSCKMNYIILAMKYLHFQVKQLQHIFWPQSRFLHRSSWLSGEKIWQRAVGGNRLLSNNDSYQQFVVSE